MEIVHICLNGPYTNNWGYQENIIPKYHKKFGNKVTVIAQNQTHTNTGEIVETKCDDYFLDDGVRVIRVAKQKKFCKKFGSVFLPYDIYHLLCDLKPDFIMVHGLIGSISALQVGKYIRRKNRKCVAVADIHEDYYNTNLENSIKRRVLTFIHRLLNRKMFPYYKKIFYVAPSCRKKAEEYYRVPKNLLDLLPLGCDTELINIKSKESVRKEIRSRYDFKEDDIVVCHGGKLDFKKKTVELIDAIKKLNQENSKINLIIFGSFADESKAKIENGILENFEFIKYAGMLKPVEYYNIYLASDIAAFPGGQSVLWQQAIACGLATLVRRHTEIEYLDLGGNTAFFDSDSIEEIYDKIRSIIIDNRYKNMKKVAEEKGAQFFSYDRISKQVLEYALGDKG